MINQDKFVEGSDLEEEFPDLEAYCCAWTWPDCAEYVQLPDGRVTFICTYENRELIEKCGWEVVE